MATAALTNGFEQFQLGLHAGREKYLVRKIPREKNTWSGKEEKGEGAEAYELLKVTLEL